jgi:ArsR family transcriptional regulator
MADNYEEQARVFKALCDEKRLRILSMLRAGEKCACVLIEHLDIGSVGAILPHEDPG